MIDNYYFCFDIYVIYGIYDIYAIYPFGDLVRGGIKFFLLF